MRSRIGTFLLLLAVLAFGAAAPALGSSKDVIRDCAEDGEVNGKYSQKELQQAERDLPNDIDEYTDCRSAIRAAMAGGSGNTGKGAPAGGIVTDSGAVAGTAADVNALGDLTKRASKGKRAGIEIDGREVLPGNAGLGGVLGGLAGSSEMPTPVALAIASLLILAVITAYLGAREKLSGVGRAALRILGR